MNLDILAFVFDLVARFSLSISYFFALLSSFFFKDVSCSRSYILCNDLLFVVFVISCLILFCLSIVLNNF